MAIGTRRVSLDILGDETILILHVPFTVHVFFCAFTVHYVPQYSILGPLLFLIYVNDSPGVSKLMFSLFADDTTLQHHGNNLKQLETEVNSELALVTQWFIDNKLCVHPQKTHFMVTKLRNNRGDPPNKNAMVVRINNQLRNFISW